MFIRNLQTKHEGFWLKTVENDLVVWNIVTNTREVWPVEITECYTSNESPGEEFVQLLEHMTSPYGATVLHESKLMLLAIKSISYFLQSGLFAQRKNVDKMIETVQEVLYVVCGTNNELGKTRDEMILFIHQQVPSLFLGAYWGYTLSKLKPENTEPKILTTNDSANSEQKSAVLPEVPVPQRPKRRSLCYNFCRCRNF